MLLEPIHFFLFVLFFTTNLLKTPIIPCVQFHNKSDVANLKW